MCDSDCMTEWLSLHSLCLCYVCVCRSRVGVCVHIFTQQAHIGRVVEHACVWLSCTRVLVYTVFILPAPDVIDMDAVLFGFEEELTAAVQVITQIHQAHVNIHLFRCPRARAHTHTHTRTHTYLTRILLPRAWWFEPEKRWRGCWRRAAGSARLACKRWRVCGRNLRKKWRPCSKSTTHSAAGWSWI